MTSSRTTSVIMTMFSKVNRRTHMYLALFLTPWILMYALSTIGMNHAGLLVKLHGDVEPPFVRERELSYLKVLPEGGTPQETARVILRDLNMEGVHRARMSADGRELIIDRANLISPRRITFRPAESTILIERQLFRGSTLLERIHRRRGYRSDYPLDDAWAASVDLVIIAILIWAASGLWMWWELKATRRWGIVCVGFGVVIFSFFALTI